MGCLFALISGFVFTRARCARVPASLADLWQLVRWEALTRAGAPLLQAGAGTFCWLEMASGDAQVNRLNERAVSACSRYLAPRAAVRYQVSGSGKLVL